MYIYIYIHIYICKYIYVYAHCADSTTMEAFMRSPTLIRFQR